jgi:type I restriction enzyme R subunit
MNDYSETFLIEQPTIELFQSLRYIHQVCFHETLGEKGTFGRTTSSDVVLIPKLKDALIKCNPYLPDEAINLAIEELTRGRGILGSTCILRHGIMYPVIYAKEVKITAEKTP